jgi:hypothetical protein
MLCSSVCQHQHHPAVMPMRRPSSVQATCRPGLFEDPWVSLLFVSSACDRPLCLVRPRSSNSNKNIAHTLTAHNKVLLEPMSACPRCPPAAAMSRMPMPCHGLPARGYMFSTGAGHRCAVARCIARSRCRARAGGRGGCASLTHHSPLTSHSVAHSLLTLPNLIFKRNFKCAFNEPVQGFKCSRPKNCALTSKILRRHRHWRDR